MFFELHFLLFLFQGNLSGVIWSSHALFEMFLHFDFVLLIIPSPPNPLDHSLFILFEASFFVSYVMLILPARSIIPTKTLPNYFTKYYGANWCLSCKVWRCFCKITICLAMWWGFFSPFYHLLYFYLCI